LYVLKVLAVPLWQATLIWCLGGIANAFAARVWGRMADRHGHKPVMVICDACKPFIVVALFLVTPAVAVPVLAVAFFLDGIWNAGNDIAGNGYLLKIAPRENRSMFIAAIAGLAGVCGGIGALAGGFFLELFNGFQVVLAGRQWNNYQLLFFVSIFLRLSCLLLLWRVKEPTSHSPLRVLSEMRGMGPLRAFTFPVGLYRRLWPEEIAADQENRTFREP
jgi:MFS family permease